MYFQVVCLDLMFEIKVRMLTNHCNWYVLKSMDMYIFLRSWLKFNGTKNFRFKFLGTAIYCVNKSPRVLQVSLAQTPYEPRHEKTGLYSYAKTNPQISFAVTGKLINTLFSLHRYPSTS